jgi:hypothetical protein
MKLCNAKKVVFGTVVEHEVWYFFLIILLHVLVTWVCVPSWYTLYSRVTTIFCCVSDEELAE